VPHERRETGRVLITGVEAVRAQLAHRGISELPEALHQLAPLVDLD
jgi:hypothetical protein